MAKKQRYRIRNWSEYNKALVNRGSLTVWFDEDSIKNWYNVIQTGQRGRPQIYSDLAIQICLTLKAVFKLPLRATQGFVSSLMQLLSLPLSAADYSLLCIRQKTLKLQLPEHQLSAEPMHLVIDSTGLKLYGEGEWKIRTHGKEKRRTWMKLHLAVNESTHDIEACVLTGNGVHDNQVLPDLLNQIPSAIAQVTGDGSYDTHSAYEAAIARGANPCFPPRKNASRQKAVDEAWRRRNHAISQVHYRGLAYWKKKNNYHRRSLAETAMFRFKQLMGERIQARSPKCQAREIGIKCLIINKMNALGMPITEPV